MDSSNQKVRADKKGSLGEFSTHREYETGETTRVWIDDRTMTKRDSKGATVT